VIEAEDEVCPEVADEAAVIEAAEAADEAEEDSVIEAADEAEEDSVVTEAVEAADEVAEEDSATEVVEVALEEVPVACEVALKSLSNPISDSKEFSLLKVKKTL